MFEGSFDTSLAVAFGVLIFSENRIRVRPCECEGNARDEHEGPAGTRSAIAFHPVSRPS